MQRRFRRRRGREEIRKIIKDFEQSGLTRTAFAHGIGVHPNLLGSWIRRQRAEREHIAEPGLVSVQVTPQITGAFTSNSLEVVLRNGRIVHVPAGFDEEALGRLVSVLEQC